MHGDNDTSPDDLSWSLSCTDRNGIIVFGYKYFASAEEAVKYAVSKVAEIQAWRSQKT